MIFLLVWLLILLFIALHAYSLMKDNHRVVMEYIRSPLGEERYALEREMNKAERKYDRWINILAATAIIPGIILTIISML